MHSLQVRILIVILALTPMSILAQQDRRPITIDDLLALKAVTDPQVSPDGEWVAYTVRSRDLEEDKSMTRIWIVPYTGGEAIPMTSADYSASRPRWTTDNKHLSFQAARSDDEKTQVWNLNRVGGEAVQVTDVKQGINSFEWSPDGTHLLLVIQDPKPADLTEDEEDDDKPLPHVIDRMQFKRDYVGYLDRRRTHLYLYTPGEDDLTQLTSGDFDDSNPVWSPDSRSVAFVSDRSDDADLHYGSDIWIVKFSGNNQELTQVTTNVGRDDSPAWSPDGTHIAYITSTGPDIGGSALTPTRHLATTAVGKDERRILTSALDRNLSTPAFSATGREIFFRLEDSGQNHLASVDLDGSNLARHIEREASVRSFMASGRNTAVLMGQSDQPQEVYSFNNGNLAQLTNVNTATLKNVSRADVEKRQFESADGTPVEAFYVRPHDFNAATRYPTILWLHGGPAAQFTYSFSDVAQLYAANGYAVIMPNPRGSTGYGQEFAHGTVAAWGKKDVQDVIAAVDHGIDIGLVDSDRLGVGGWSYGGILTNYVITQTTRFDAAISGASLGLITANYGHDHYQLMYEMEFGLPWEEPDRYVNLSPFSKIEAITTPTLWMGGALDWNVPIINSEQMYIGMKRLGRKTQLVVYPDEHHGIRRPSFEKDRFERWLAWYDDYLK